MHRLALIKNESIIVIDAYHCERERENESEAAHFNADKISSSVF